MLEFITWLDNTALAEWARAPSWPYPTFLTLHAIGMAFLVGTLTGINLRLLGVARSLPIAPLEGLLPIAWIGFWINAASGTLMFIGDAVNEYYNVTFRLKMLFIAVGVVNVLLLKSVAFRGAAALDAGADAPMRVKLLAGISLAAWVGAIMAGRLAAYLP